MSTLAQELPKVIARLELKYGPDNPFVKMLKQQLAAIQQYGDASTKEIWMMQAREFPPAGNPPDTGDKKQIPAYDLNNLPDDPAKAVGEYSERLFHAPKEKHTFKALKTDEDYRKARNYSVGTFYRVASLPKADEQVDPMAGAAEIIEKWGRKEARKYGGKGKKNG